MESARTIIERLDLQPHPEGGWYRETWRGPPGPDGRSIGTAIHFLLEADQRSHWHRVDAAEIWLFHAGDPLRLSLAEAETGPVRNILLGPDVHAGHAPQHVIAAHEWQAAEPGPVGVSGYSLVFCIVAPGFEFSGFTLAPPDWAPGR